MALLSGQNITFGFGAPPLLEGLTLHLEDGERVALVGRNGAGKSTLMRILGGEVSPNEGEIVLQKGARVARLPQAVPEGLSGSVFEIVAEGANQETIPDYQVNAVITRLQLDADADFAALSGGLKRRVLLARALVLSPDVLLLDEPTNHLDIESIQWLEEFLPRAVKTILFVTHDRVFLQKLATRIVEIDRGQLNSYECDYKTYLERRAAALEAQSKGNRNFDRKLAEEEVWVRRGIKARQTRDEGRVRALLRMREERRNRRAQIGSARLQIQDVERSGQLVIEAQNVGFDYASTAPRGSTPARSSTPLVHDFSTTIFRGDKIGLIGANGCGKTTLLRLLLKQIEAQSGAVRLGTRLQIAYFDQMRAQLDEEKTVWHNVAGENQTVTFNGQQRHIIGYLGDFLFSKERARSPVSVLSGGERNRLLLAKLFAQPANLLVMDEPTNDLDIETLDLLEELLLDFPGTLLLVSHDRAFLNNVVTSVLAPSGDGRWEEYAGGYDDWLRVRPAPIEKAPTPELKSKPKSDKPRKISFAQKQELKALPARLETLEAQQSELYETLGDGAFYQNGGDAAATQARLKNVQNEIAAGYARWEELEEIPAE